MNQKMHISGQALPQYKYYLFLSMLACTILLVCDIVVYKIVSLGPGLRPASALIYPITYYIGDIIAEVYGYQYARRTIWTMMACHLIFCILLYFSIMLPSPDSWEHQAAYDQVFGNILFTGIGSFVGIPAGYFVNAYLISKFKLRMHGKRFWLRSLVSTAIGQGVMHVITYTAQFLHIYTIAEVAHLIFSAWVFKCVYALVAVIPTTILVYFIKKKEGVDVYDYEVNYNPFSLAISGVRKNRDTK